MPDMTRRLGQNELETGQHWRDVPPFRFRLMFVGVRTRTVPRHQGCGIAEIGTAAAALCNTARLALQQT